MKTKQEQIEEIVKIILESSKKCLDTDCDCCVDQYEKECAQYRKAVALVQAGYGKVSEYESEIERLKTEKVKQAQIDVLNKIKNCRYATDSDCYPYLERIVNKLIKEVENEQKD